MFKKRNKQHDILAKITNNNLVYRYTLLIFGVLIVTISYNIFFVPHNVVSMGVSGLAIVIQKIFQVDPSLFILISSILLLVASRILLGREMTARSIIGSLLFPLLVKLTGNITSFIDLSNVNMILIALFGGVASGFGYGIIFKTGFTTGGTDILNQIVSKYFKVSIGQAMVFVDGLIVVSGGLVFGPIMMMYSIIVLYIISLMTDKVILGISNNKAFYIMTKKETEVKNYIMENLSNGLTMVEARGGYSNKKQTMIMCVIPTQNYFILKEGIKEIDDKAFFVVTDSYEVSGQNIKN